MERRRSYRIPVSIPLEVRPHSGGELTAMIVNASADGIAALSAFRLASGAGALLRTRVRPGARDLWLQAVVLRTLPCDAGVWNRLTIFRLWAQASSGLDTGADLMADLHVGLDTVVPPRPLAVVRGRTVVVSGTSSLRTRRR